MAGKKHTYSSEYTDAQIEEIVKLRTSGKPWEEIERLINRKYKLNKSAEAMRHVFRKYSKLENSEKPKHPYHDFTKSALGDIIKKNNVSRGIYFITAASPTSSLDYNDDEMRKAQSGEYFVAKNVFEPGFKAIQNYCKRRGAELIILPMRAHVKSLREQPQHYDPILRPYLKNFATEYIFNPHLKAIEAQINPQQINPLTGIKRLGRGRNNIFSESSEVRRQVDRFKTSILVAHSKQMMEVVPTGNNTHPRIIHSTGAITKPSYLRNRIGMIASEDHCLGGLIVEVKGDKFFIRQAQFDPSDGSFVDLGTRYFSDGKVKKERAEAFKMGDIHPGFEDSEVLKVWYEVWGITKPKRIFYEDFFDGASISHHTQYKNITKFRRPDHFKSLEAELQRCREVLEETWNNAPKDAELIATASNHPEHLRKYLDEGRYLRDDINFYVAHKMVVAECEGRNALQEYIDPELRMTWLHENDDYFVEGVQLGAHGHSGVNGARGSAVNLETAYYDAMLAHSHTPGIYHNIYVVGHSSQKRHGYNEGPSTWIPCSGLVYARGQKQLIMVIGGEWKLG